MRLEVNTPDLLKAINGEIKAGERAVTGALQIAGQELKISWREQITAAGLGYKLAKTIRSRRYPKDKDSFNAASLVWSKAPKIIETYDRGVTIRAKSGLWLAIPTKHAGRGLGGVKVTPLGWERKTGLKLRFVHRPGKPGLLVADDLRARKGKRGGFAVASKTARRTRRGLVTKIIFVLVPQVRLRKRLDLARDAKRVAGMVPGLIVRNWKE